MTLTDLCYRVCTALDAVGTRADADFIIMFGNSSDAASALLSCGFTEDNGIYRSDAAPYTVEFPPGPLMIGGDYISEFATIRRSDEVLHVLRPTDCVRDRLLWYYHYADFSALSAAVGVAEANKVDMAAIRDWSAREKALEKFEFFNRQIAAANVRGSKTKAL